MARLLRIPEISAGATDAVLATWPLAENVPYSAADVIATVETSKAVIDIEAEEDGMILRRLVGEGASVAVGQPIALIGVPGESADDIGELLRAQGLAAAAAVTSPAAAGNEQNQWSGQHDDGQRIFISPLARRLALEGGLDLRAIAGSGPGGRIMRRDVEQALPAARAAQAALAQVERGAQAEPAAQAASPEQAAPTEAAAGLPATTIRPKPARAGFPAVAAGVSGSVAAAAPAGSQMPAPYTAVPHSRVRRAIAGRLTESKQTVPHFYLSGNARADKLLRLRAELNDGSSAARVSVNDLVIKAVARAHQLVPAMNVIWTPDALHSFDSVDIGVAISGPRGLVTPVVRSVERHAISALAAMIADLIERAGTGRLQQRELEGGTTCVTNLGMFGVEQFSAIINPPQSSILAVGAVHDAPVVKHGKLRVGSVMHVTLSADHRAVDGTTAAEWMRAFVALVEHPVQILA
jgi:pyruvate dehydrogenase E2 component (dihydrolipoyllysine-residue acetyltransferase)